MNNKLKDFIYIFIEDKKLLKNIISLDNLIISTDKNNNTNNINDIFIFDNYDDSIIKIKELGKYVLCKKDEKFVKIFGNNYPGYYNNIEDLNKIIDYLYHNIKNNNKFYFDFIKNKKVLFISNDIIWNFYSGNSIWASNFLKIIKKMNNIDIDVVISRKMNSISVDNIFNKELSFCKFINLLNNKKNIVVKENNSIIKTIKLIKYINSIIKKYDYLILRGYNFIKKFYKFFNPLSISKMIYIQMNKNEEKLKQLSNLKIIHMTFLEYFDRKDKQNAYIIPPLIEEKITINEIKKIYNFCYVGTLHNNSGILTLCNFFAKNPKLQIIFAGKILASFDKELKIIINNFKNNKNIIFNVSQSGLDKKICDKIIEQSSVGIRIDDLYECLSSKILTYINYEIPIILQRTKTHEYLFGHNYPLFLPQNKYISIDDLNNVINNKINLESVKKIIKNTKKLLDPDNLIKKNFKF
jgi:hypothetical protein